MSNTKSNASASVGNLPPCTLLRLRMATRRATRLYDEMMRAAGIGAAQFGVLMALSGKDGASVTGLAHILGMDRTTLTRNLRPLVREGLVIVEEGSDMRSRSVQLTGEGARRLVHARGLWRKAQAAVVASLGETETRDLNASLALAIARLP